MDAPDSPAPDATDSPDARRWTVIDREQRRVLGVLIEKAKTTKDAYPLTLNSLRTGCNQKSNRFPQMELDDHRVEEAIDKLRERGAVAIIQGDSRVEKYRHLAYEWLGVNKVELAVMGELLLRGAQTVGELRGRAARMEPIKGMAELTPVVQGLVQKGLVAYFTPPGRGAVVTHQLYEPKELEKVRRDLGLSAAPSPAVAPSPAAGPSLEGPSPEGPAALSSPSANGGSADLRAELAALRVDLQEEITKLRGEVEDLRDRLLG